MAEMTLGPSTTYTATEVAKVLKVHVSTVYFLLHKKQLRGFMIGRHWRISNQELDDFIIGEWG